ncbi:MAG TPA: hypothetical protein VKD91_17660 [Pyrinomonadaceae bacterium]|nr:hypothetical protein [Pyrinomonadaceae bacterium]
MNQQRDSDEDSEMLEEYDFSGGVRGKYVDRFASGAKVIILDADVARVFTNSESVNEALRAIIQRQPNNARS